VAAGSFAQPEVRERESKTTELFVSVLRRALKSAQLFSRRLDIQPDVCIYMYFPAHTHAMYVHDVSVDEVVCKLLH
jgi:hypothetical protein